MTLQFHDVSKADELIRNGWSPSSFWARIDLSNPDGCWPWLRGCDSNGYGHVGVHGDVYLTHRLAYELLVGPIPAGLTIDHICRNRPCCNPYHMEPVTRGENRRRAPISGRAAVHAAKTHCDNGHEFTVENTQLYVRPGKAATRVCRACASEKNRRYLARRAARSAA